MSVTTILNKIKARLPRSIHVHKGMPTDLTVIALIGLTSLSWFGGNYLIKTGDDFFPLDPAYIYPTSPYLWNHVISTGMVLDPFAVVNFPFFAFLALLSSIGVPLIVSQKMFYYLSFTLSGIFMYFLVTTLVDQNKRVAGLTSALFYMMNPFSLSVIWWAHYTTFFFTYPIAPLLLALYIKGINAKRKIKHVIMIGILQLIASPIFDDPSAAFVTVFLMPFLFFVFYVLLKRRDRAKVVAAVRFSVLLGVFTFLINMWWVLPGFYFYKVRYELGTEAYSSLMVFTGGSAWSNMLNTLRLLGYYFIYEKWYPVSVYAWAQTYSSPTFTAISCLIPILTFASLIFKPRDRYTVFFAMLSVFGLFLAKGAAEPLGCINLWFFQNLPFAILFRTHFARLGPIVVLSYSFLIGVTFSKLWKLVEWTGVRLSSRVQDKPGKLQKSLRATLIVFMLSSIVLFGVYNYPFWTGDVIYPGSQYLPSARIQVPSYYIDAGNYINAQPEEFRILDIPPRVGGTSAYSWEQGYIGSDAIDQYYFHKPLVGIGLFSSLDKHVFDLISHNQSSSSIVNLLSLMNIKYILVHRDWNSSLIGWYSPSPEVAAEVLNYKEGIYLEKSFGKLDLYRNEYWRPLHLYVTPNAVLVQGGLDEMVWVVEREDFIIGDCVLFLSGQLTPSQLANLPARALEPQEFTVPSGAKGPVISYEKINPTKYVAHVIDASQPFFLVFSESYHKDWVAYVNGEQLSEDQHFIANGYANAWYINKTGTYTITLEFWPQKLFYTGSTISITTLILCILYISKDKIKTIYKRYIKKNNRQ